MPSKTSNSCKSRPSPWKVARCCAEEDLARLAVEELAPELRAGDRVLLEGPMGAGKTTFARALLFGLKVTQPPEGSPSFAIAHEYTSSLVGGVVHLDFYRLKNEAEIEDAGIPSYFWERDLVVIAEWTSLWPEFYEQVLRSGRNWKVSLSFSEESELHRDVEINLKP